MRNGERNTASIADAGSRSLWQISVVPVGDFASPPFGIAQGPATTSSSGTTSSACTAEVASLDSDGSGSSSSSNAASAVPPPSSGSTCGAGIPGLRLERLLGKGGCGEAWLATQALPEGGTRQVVVKRAITSGLAFLLNAGGPGSDLAHEAEVMRAMQGNPHAVQLYDVISDKDGCTCLIMQYASQQSLTQELDTCLAQRDSDVATAKAAVASAKAAGASAKDLKPLRRAADAARCRMVLGRQRLAQLARSVLLALKQLGSAGYLHGDIKPDNILIDEAGNYMLGDFGISARKVKGAWPWLGGTAMFTAPEVEAALKRTRLFDTVTLFADLASLGLTLASAAVYHGDLGSLYAYRDYRAQLPP